MYELDPKLFNLLETEYLDDGTLESGKSGYGCVDAPRLWRLHLDKTMTEKLKFRKSRYDECLYYFFDNDRKY